MIWFKGKRIGFDENPRSNVCSKCGKKYPEDLKQQTHIHHIKYDSKNPLAHTIELCGSCHGIAHGDRRRPLLIELPNEEIAKLYLSGVSENALSKTYNVNRGAIRNRLILQGVQIRNQSEAETLKWSQMDDVQRKNQVKKAHQARRKKEC